MQKATPTEKRMLDDITMDLMNFRSFSYNAGSMNIHNCLLMYGKHMTISNNNASLICNIKTSIGEKKLSFIGKLLIKCFVNMSNKYGAANNVNGKTTPIAIKHLINVLRKAFR